MSRPIRSAVLWALAGAVAALATLLVGVDRTDLVLDAYLVYLAALAAMAASRIAAGAFPRSRRVVPSVLARRPRAVGRPEALRVTEDVVALGVADNFDLHFQLRPVLREIATEGVVAKAGIDLDGGSGRAARLFEPGTWELVRPDRPRPEGEHGKGITRPALDAVVRDLEKMLA